MRIVDNDLFSIQEARILAENAAKAQKELSAFDQVYLDVIVENVAKEITPHLEEFAKMSQMETEYGIWQDKLLKNQFASKYLCDKLRDMKCVGIIDEDKDSKTIDVGIPRGVILGLCPATSPVSTVIYKTLIAIKSGNAIIFSAHPRAKDVSSKLIDILTDIAVKNGLPKGGIGYLSTLTTKGTEELIRHPQVGIIINTGVPSMLSVIHNSGKPVIYGGAGNGPAFIERTADIKKAVKDIISSKTFDNGVVSASEQAIIVESCIDGVVQNELTQNGAYFMSEEESTSIGELLFEKDWTLNSETVGQNAMKLAKDAGINVPPNTVLLVSMQKYVFDTNPFSKEKLCPVVAYYTEDDWMHACEKCIELILGEGNSHSLVIHSNDPEVIYQFVMKKPVGRILVNTPGIFGSMGMTTNLFPAMTLGSASAGQGIASDNVSPMNLIYIRKVGYGVRTKDEFADWINGSIANDIAICNDSTSSNSADSRKKNYDKQELTNILLKITKELKNR